MKRSCLTCIQLPLLCSSIFFEFIMISKSYLYLHCTFLIRAELFCCATYPVTDYSSLSTRTLIWTKEWKSELSKLFKAKFSFSLTMSLDKRFHSHPGTKIVVFGHILVPTFVFTYTSAVLNSIKIINKTHVVTKERHSWFSISKE